MTTTTVLARNGHSLSGDVQRNGWIDFLNEGDYTETQAAALVDALMAAQRTEFESSLPEGCFWYPSTSEIVGPVDTEIDEDVDDLMRDAAQHVTDNFETIEGEALKGLK